MIVVSELRTVDSLEACRREWQSLLDRTPGVPFFRSLDWFLLQQRRFDGERDPRVLLVTVAGKPTGIVPLVARRLETSLGRLSALMYASDGYELTSGVVGSSQTAALYGALQYLRDAPRDWEILELRGIDDTGLDRGRTANSLGLAGLPALSRPWHDVFELNPQTAGTLSSTRLPADMTFCRNRPSESEVGTEGHHRGEAAQCLATIPELPFTEARYLQDLYELACRQGMADLCVVQRRGQVRGFSLSVQRKGLLQVVATGWEPHPDDLYRNTLAAGMIQSGADLGDVEYLISASDASLFAEYDVGQRSVSRLTHFSDRSPRGQLLRINQWRRSWTGGNAVLARPAAD
ncbi:MAG: hypothetical protein KF777_04075 [Planctomycetaceae bacterium]|nr:hypothetical protein [Planctomycetaceae bacterium]